MSNLVELQDETSIDEMEDRKHELSMIKKEIHELGRNNNLRPSEKAGLLKELQTTLTYCNEEYNELARNLRKNYL